MSLYLGLEVNLSQSGSIIGVNDLFERRLQRKGLIEPEAIGGTQARATDGTSIGEDDGDELRG